MTRNQHSTSPPLTVPANMSLDRNMQQNATMNASRSKRESETDVLMMDDVQFTASLDRLLDSELVNSAYNNHGTSGGQAQVVSTDPSVASTVSSKSCQQTTKTTTMPASISTNTGGSASLPPPPPSQKPLPHPGIPATTGVAPTGTLLAPPLANPVGAMTSSSITQRLAFALPNIAAPSNIMTHSTLQQHVNNHRGGQKRARDVSMDISEDESERERRRQDRNQREQQRSRRITEQIAHLRTVLTQGGVPCKPDKNSTLISVADYIQQLQTRSNFLDGEHKKLLDTIARTNEMVNNQYYQATADGTSSISVSTAASQPVSNDLLSDGMTGGPLEDENDVFVQGLDYKSVFDKCGIALAVASIDGRFIDCNAEFVTLCGYSRSELLPGGERSNKMEPSDVPSKSSSEGAPPRNLSLFNLLNREDMEKVFSSMSEMLRRPVVRTLEATLQDAASPQVDCYSGSIRQNREETKSIQLRMNITLVRTPGGRPKFFNCSLTTD